MLKINIVWWLLITFILLLIFSMRSPLILPHLFHYFSSLTYFLSIKHLNSQNKRGINSS